ncbi:MAG TPA: hypothetical protein VFP81_03990 [Propionibacteriaceae bacterium]|nr:hypothetical protein [Propionibacteriaceae bacterium]
MSNTIDRSPLRQALDAAIAESNGAKLSMKDLTVLSPQIDPFRLDTPANHKIGKWLADTASTLGLGGRKIHLRGLHYMILGQPKPDGSAYTNTKPIGYGYPVKPEKRRGGWAISRSTRSLITATPPRSCGSSRSRSRTATSP